MAHIYTNHGEPETLQGTPEHEWAGEAQTARRPGKCTAAAAGGNQGRVANREWEKTGAKNPKKSDSCELRKQMAVEDLI